MKKNLKQFSHLPGTQVVLLIVLLVAVALRGAQAAPAEPEPVPEVRKSIFQDDLKNGKDPFFPKSTRRSAKNVVPTAVAIPPMAQLALKGISGPANRRFALINNQPFAAGETALVRTATGGQVKVHCWEIRENSVIVSVEGDAERKELRFSEDQ